MDDKKLKKLALAIDLDTQTAKTTFREIERLDSDIENIQSDITVIQDDAQKIVEAIGEIEQTKATKQELEYAINSVALTPGPRGFKGEKGDSGRDGKDGKDSIIPGPKGDKGDSIIGPVGPAGKDGLNAVVDYEKVVNETLELLGDTEETPEDIRNKLELLQGDERLDKSAIKGIKEIEDKIENARTTIYNQGGITRAAVEELIAENDASNDTLQGVTDRGATTDNVITIPGVQFNTTATPATNAEGLLQWNATDGTLDLGMSGGDVTMQIGQELFAKVRNESGYETISNGQAVYISGRTGVFPDVRKARSDIEETASILGVATQDITSPSYGFVTTMGYVRGIKTNYSGTGIWGTTWAAGDHLYVSKTNAGQLTNVEPDAPHHSDIVATVGVLSTGSSLNGSILVNINKHKTLEELTDVNGTDLTTTGQIPVWNETSKYFDFDKNINNYFLRAGDRVGSDTDNTAFDSTGHQTMVGNAKPWEDLRIEPQVRGTGANNPAFEKYFDDAGGTSRGVYLYSFSDEVTNNQKEIFFTMQMPHAWDGGAISIHVHWVGSASDTNATPIFGLEYTWKDIGQVFGDTSIVYTTGGNIDSDGTPDPDVTAGKHYISEFADLIPGTTADGISSILIGRLFRFSGDASDTYDVSGNKCGLLYIDAHYQSSSLGSTEEYTK